MVRAGLVCIFFGSLAFGQVTGIEGTWTGVLNAGFNKLHVVLHVDPDGSAKLDSLDQGTMGIPVSDVQLTGSHVSAVIKSLKGSFEGELIDNGTRIQGKWKQGLSLPITFVRSDEAPGLKRPQMPHGPFPYSQEDVIFASLAKDVTLAGTLTVPAGTGPFPTVALITGSGPQDRDETMLGHKPFWVLADHLSRHGIAVLRVDDRGIGKSTGNFATATTQDFADDAEGAVRYLKTRKEVGRIGLLGHSEGAAIAPLVANRSSDVGFVIMLAGPAVPGDQVILEQQALIVKAMGLPDSFLEQNREMERKILEIVKNESDPAVAKTKMTELTAGLPKEVTAALGDQFTQAATPWFHFFVNYDPGTALRVLKQPVLALNGSLDVQVSASQNLPAIAQALEAGHNNDYQIVKLAGLNHLFQNARTGAPGEYGAIEETMSPDVLDLVTTWIGRHSK